MSLYLVGREAPFLDTAPRAERGDSVQELGGRGGDDLVTRHQPANFGQNTGSPTGLPTCHQRLTGEPESPLTEGFPLDAPEPFFIDWLSLYQTHEHDLPLIDAGCVMGVDEDGSLIWKTVRKLPIEGSYETRVNVRCDGRTVWFEGNVSRFGRTDNLFGFSLAECVRLVNEILERLGLPPFTAGRKGWHHVKVCGNGEFSDEDRNRTGQEVREFWTGARFTRIDMTANFSCGSLADARAYMEWLGTQAHSARVKVGTHADGETVDWGRGSRRVYSKCYLKSAEMARRGGPDELVSYCEAEGVIRFEVTVKSTQLIRMGCQYLGSMNMHQLELLYEERRSVLSRADHVHDDLANLPGAIRRTARDYLAGDDLTVSLSERTFRRHRKELLPFGIDIAVRRNVFEFKPRVRVIELRALSAPSWYSFERKAA